MPITNNIHWDERLEAFKGHETIPYIATAVAAASHCDDCTAAFEPDDVVSLVIDIQQTNHFWLAGSRHFDSYVCHRTCQSPDLSLREVIGLGAHADTHASSNDD